MGGRGGAEDAEKPHGLDCCLVDGLDCCLVESAQKWAILYLLYPLMADMVLVEGDTHGQVHSVRRPLPR